MVKRWYSTLTILTCLLFKNMVLNLPMNFWDKLSIKKVSMILRNSYSWKFQMLYSLLHVLHQVEVVTLFLLVCLDISIWYGLLISLTDLWILSSLPFLRDSCQVQKVSKNSPLQSLNHLYKCTERSEQNYYQPQQNPTIHST